MELTNKLKVLRLLAGFGQKELAVDLGMAAATHINRWERGESHPRTNMLQKIGEALGIYWPWLQDSRMPLSTAAFIYFRPLSPYSDYTPRWLSLLPRELSELLPELFFELNITDVWCVQAHCKGGIIVASKEGFTLMIACTPSLYEILSSVLTDAKQAEIDDTLYAEQLFLSTRTQEIMKIIGVGYIEPEVKQSAPAQAQISVEVKAHAPLNSDYHELREAIIKQMDLFISKMDLSKAEVKVNISAPKSTYEIVSGLVYDPALKQLALQLENRVVYGKLAV